jgi:hypothetical protein
LGQFLGEQFEGGREVRTLDEAVLILRKSSGLRFDPELPGFHLYGADICLEAEARRLKCYAISAFCIHNTNGYNLLPRQFWRNYLFLRRKWRSRLPILTSCTEVTPWCSHILRLSLGTLRDMARGRHYRGLRVRDPKRLYGELQAGWRRQHDHEAAAGQ